MDKATVLQLDFAVRQGGQFFIMGHDDEGLLELVPQFEEELMQFAGVVGVEVAGGLVGEDDLGFVDEGAGHGHPLLLAPRQLGRLVGDPLLEMQEVEQLLRLFQRLLAGEPRDHGRQGHILRGRELGQQMVELEDEADVTVAEVRQRLVLEAADVGALDDDGPAVGAVERADDVQQGRLAGTGRADNRHYLTIPYRQGYLLQDLQAAVGFFDFLDLDHLIRSKTM